MHEQVDPIFRSTGDGVIVRRPLPVASILLIWLIVMVLVELVAWML